MVESRSTRRWLRRVFCAGAVAWAALIPIAAFAASWPVRSPVVDLSIALPYAVGAVICHQQPARSFALWSHQLPVCARCTGLYFGAAIAALVGAIRTAKVAQGFLGPPKRGTSEGASPAKTMLLVAALPTIATLAYEWSTGVAPSNLLRAIAGVPLGAAVAWAILTAVDDQVN